MVKPIDLMQEFGSCPHCRVFKRLDQFGYCATKFERDGYQCALARHWATDAEGEMCTIQDWESCPLNLH